MLNHSFAALLSFTLIFCIIFLVTRKKAGALHYDEMQLQIRRGVRISWVFRQLLCCWL